jgi:hypothetical protein
VWCEKLNELICGGRNVSTLRSCIILPRDVQRDLQILEALIELTLHVALEEIEESLRLPDATPATLSAWWLVGVDKSVLDPENTVSIGNEKVRLFVVFRILEVREVERIREPDQILALFLLLVAEHQKRLA